MESVVQTENAGRGAVEIDFAEAEGAQDDTPVSESGRSRSWVRGACMTFDSNLMERLTLFHRRNSLVQASTTVALQVRVSCHSR